VRAPYDPDLERRESPRYATAAMPRADILLTSLVVALLPVCFWQPWIGVLVYSWIGYMNPHRLMHGFAYATPFAKMAAIPTLLGLIRIRRTATIPRTPAVWLLLALWATFLLSTILTAIQPGLAWPAFIETSKMLLMTAVTMVFFRDRPKIRLLLFVIAASIGFYGVTGGIWAIQTAGYERLHGPPESAIGDNNALGFALTIVLPLFVYLRYEEQRPWLRHLLVVAFGLSVLAICATYSRGAFLGLLVVLALMLVKTRFRDGAILIALLIDGAVVMLAPPKWVKRMETIPTAHRVDPSGVQRLNSWYVAYQLGLDHPLLGAGFRPFSPEIYERYMPGYFDYHDAHNHFLQMFAEHGLPGLLLFIALIVSVLLSLRRTIRATRGDPSQRWRYHYAHAIEVSMVAYVAGGAFLNMPYFDLFYQLVAVAVLLQQGVMAPHSRTPSQSA
jgi:probable O-glycosylation ligase (exosortase A-associated)